MKKRLFCTVLAALLVMGLLVFPAAAEEYSGSCGDNATWSFNPDTGTLTISGTGPMQNFDSSLSLPWKDIEKQVKSLVVENGITTIGDNAFTYMQSMTQVQLPDTLTQVGIRAFQGCTAITSINFPNALQRIGQQAFSSIRITRLVLPESLIECGSEAFSGCKELVSVSLPESLEKIPYGMFDSCFSLTSITIPSGVKDFDARPFASCSRLSSITFLGDAPNFHASAFYNLTVMVTYPGDNATWTKNKLLNYAGTVTWVPSGNAPLGGTFGRSNTMTWELNNGVLTITGNGYMDGWNNQQEIPWYPYRGKIKKVVLSGRIENIYANAFRDHTELTEVQLVNTITVVFNGAFQNCSSLKTVTLPDSVTSLGNQAFKDCSSLTSVKLSANISSLDGWTFSGCSSLKSITVPAKVKSLASSVFENGPKEIFFLGNFPTNIQNPAAYYSGAFNGFKGTVYYPANNSTWTAAKIKEQVNIYGDNINFVASEALNKPASNAGGSGSAGSTGSTTTTPGSSTQETTPDVTEPTVPATIPEGSTPASSVDATTPEATVPAPEQTEPAPAIPKKAFPWGIIAIGVAVIAAGGAGATVFVLKKRKQK